MRRWKVCGLCQSQGRNRVRCVQGLVVQNPLNMGYLGVKTVVAVLRGEKVPDRIDTGVGFVTRENFNDPAMADIVHPPLDQYLK